MCADHNADQTTDDFSYKRVIREVNEKYRVEQDERFEAILRRVWRLKSDEVRKLRLHFRQDHTTHDFLNLLDDSHPWKDYLNGYEVEYKDCHIETLESAAERVSLSFRASAEPDPNDINKARWQIVIVRPLAENEG